MMAAKRWNAARSCRKRGFLVSLANLSCSINHCKRHSYKESGVGEKKARWQTNLLLNILRREVPIKVEATFTDGHHRLVPELKVQCSPSKQSGESLSQITRRQKSPVRAGCQWCARCNAWRRADAHRPLNTGIPLSLWRYGRPPCSLVPTSLRQARTCEHGVGQDNHTPCGGSTHP